MLELEGASPERAAECARLADGDGARARLLASESGYALRDAGEKLARAALRGGAATARPWLELLKAAGASGKSASQGVEAAAQSRLELAAKSERRRLEREAEERGKRAGRRAESAAVDLALFVAERWLRDFHRAAVGATDLLPEEGGDALAAQAARVAPADLREAIERIGRTRRALRLNVNRELALESLAHELDGVLA